MTSDSSPRRGPLAAIVAAVGLLILVGVVGLGTPPSDEAGDDFRAGLPGFGRGRDHNDYHHHDHRCRPPSATYAPLESPIFVVPDERDTLMYSWHPSASEQQWVALGSFPRHLDFDAAGRWLAYIPDEDGDGVGDLWVGLGNGITVATVARCHQCRLASGVRGQSGVDRLRP